MHPTVKASFRADRFLRQVFTRAKLSFIVAFFDFYQYKSIVLLCKRLLPTDG